MLALADALSDPLPAIVMVEGEAGIGKSRLVREFLASSSASGQRALVGLCPPLREPFTLGPVVDAVRHARHGVADLPLNPLAGALRPLFPEWAADLPPALDTLDDPAAARHRLFRAMADLVACMDVTALVVEDVHWADEATLEFLLFLTARRQLNLLLTYRPEDLPAGSPLLRLTSRAHTGTVQLRLVLPPLDTAGTAQLVSSMLDGQRVSDRFAAFLQHNTDGLPLAVEESVRLLNDRADLIRYHGEWARRGLDELAVPSTIRDSVVERAQRLPPAAQRILQAAAVLSSPSDPATLATIGGVDAAEFPAGAAAAVDSSLLYEDATGQVAFRHVLSSSAIYETTPGSDRRIMHRRAGQLLEAAEPPCLADIARHYRHGNDLASWASFAERAADLAISTGDNTAAIILLNDLVRRVDLPGDERERLALKLGFAALTRKAVGLDLARQGVETLRSVLDAPGMSAEARGKIRNPLGRLLQQMGDFDAGRAELESAVEHLGSDPVEAMRVMIFLSWPRGTTCPFARHMYWLRRATRVAPRSMSRFDRMDLAVYRATALLLLGQEAGWTVAAEIPAKAEVAADLPLIARGHLNSGHAAVQWGRYAEARSRLQVAIRFARQIGNQRILDDAVVTEAHLDWFTGSWDSLSERLRGLLDTDDLEPPNRLELASLNGQLAIAFGDNDAASELLTHAISEAQRQASLDELMEPAAALARLRQAHGLLDQALELTEEPARILSRKGVWVWGTELVPARVEALIAAGRSEDAGRLVAEFARGLRGRTAPAPKAALALCRAILAECQPDHTRAAAAFGRAAAAWEALPRPYDAMLAQERQAHCLIRAGRLDAGHALLSRTGQGLADLGARADAERLARLQPRRRGRRSYGAELSPRELEVVRQVVAGRTNRQIAEVLCRSPKTVASQVNSAMRKLNVSTRTALAVSVIEAGVLLNDDGCGASRFAG